MNKKVSNEDETLTELKWGDICRENFGIKPSKKKKGSHGSACTEQNPVLLLPHY